MTIKHFLGHFLGFLSDIVTHNSLETEGQYNDGQEPMQSIKSRSNIPSLIFQALALEPLRAVKSLRLSIEQHN
jgi:hypothetical protein